MQQTTKIKRNEKNSCKALYIKQTCGVLRKLEKHLKKNLRNIFSFFYFLFEIEGKKVIFRWYINIYIYK